MSDLLNTVLPSWGLLCLHVSSHGSSVDSAQDLRIRGRWLESRLGRFLFEDIDDNH